MGADRVGRAARLVLLALGLAAGIAVLTGLPLRQVQQVRVTAHRYDFTPAEIHVRVAVPVQLLITSEDTDHGITIPGLRLERVVIRGRTTTLEFTPERPGRYEFQCAVECGPGHSRMTGVLIVE